jgi:hypothetical protein
MGMAVEKINIVWLGWILFFGALIPVRLAEWYWLLRIAFKQRVRGHSQIESSILLGTFVSYVLDAIGVLLLSSCPEVCGFAERKLR